MPAHQSHGNPERNVAIEEFSAQALFAENFDGFELQRLLAMGSSVEATKLSAQYGLEQRQQKSPNSALLAILKNDGELIFNVSGDEVSADAGDQLVYLTKGQLPR